MCEVRPSGAHRLPLAYCQPKLGLLPWAPLTENPRFACGIASPGNAPARTRLAWYPSHMTPVFLAGSLFEADLMVERLKQNGIAAIVRNRELQGALGELPMTLLPEVWVVEDSDYEAALAELKDVEASGLQAKGPEITCTSCGEKSPGNFELCWKCRKDLAPG